MIFKGAVHEIRALLGARGNEQQGRRYGVIIQSDRFSTSTIAVAPTSSSAGPAIYRPEIVLNGEKTRILTDQIYSVDPGRLGSFAGSLDSSELIDLDRALMLRFGLV